jgi:hypothetical protein
MKFSQRMNSPRPNRSIRQGGASQWTLRPQDLVVALKLVVLRGERLTYAKLGKRLYLSQFEAHAACKRLIAAKLASDLPGGVRPVIPTLRNFLIFGAPHCFPAVRDELTIGIPTAQAANPMKEKVLFADDNPPVWPHPGGWVRGMSLLPLYAKAPYAALEDASLYELLALFDALRIGQKREQAMAIESIDARLQENVQ